LAAAERLTASRSQARTGGSRVGGRTREQPRWVSTHQRVQKREALPCTGPTDPINFEVFSAGAAVDGTPLTSSVRRCDAGALADEAPDNYFAYIYGKCLPQPDVGCLPPLQIRTYPACERAFADYSFEGEPLPNRQLPSVEGAEVVEIDFLVDHRIEIYSGTSTIVISAADETLEKEAIDLLRGQEAGFPPATTADSLSQKSKRGLQPPAQGATKGELRCHV
jgi:hypothetical protein